MSLRPSCSTALGQLKSAFAADTPGVLSQTDVQMPKTRLTNNSRGFPAAIVNADRLPSVPAVVVRTGHGWPVLKVPAQSLLVAIGRAEDIRLAQMLAFKRCAIAGQRWL